jgi:outer membrane lipoprotein SlyB
VLDSDQTETRDVDSTTTGPDRHPRETHATTGGAAAAGAVTGGVIGLTGGPIGAAIGALGGAIVGAAAERMMHSDEGKESEEEDAEREAP